MQEEDAPLIVMVEADEALGRIVASYLYHDGYRVLHFTSLAEAVAAVRTMNSGRSTHAQTHAARGYPDPSRGPAGTPIGQDAQRSESGVERRVEGPAPALVLLDLDSLEPQEMMGLARLDDDTQAADPSVEAEAEGLSELMAFPLLLFAGDRFPTWWARRREGASVLYKPFEIHELRRQVGGTLASTGIEP